MEEVINLHLKHAQETCELYDVFLSFRGEDTRNNIAGLVYRDLKREGIKVYMDSPSLEGGEEIKPALDEAIRRSKISIPIFSEGYAESKWCLRELEEIVKCHRSNGQKILPIFYGVEPTDVSHQTSRRYARAFHRYSEKNEVQTIQNWKQSLNFVGGIAGYDLKQVNGNESELVQLIVDWVLKELRTNRLGDAKNPILLGDDINPIGLGDAKNPIIL
ncbi:disease resistance protein L6-like [Macadamia integrifolia]|uniref:disease resistance protein L6-like n=1 Tax=Macadamia integrifolia TaxID=60698 RepID=UPI001C4E7165|nr:disease resistance protein L6-like [Macadamia integrifolia]